METKKDVIGKYHAKYKILAGIGILASSVLYAFGFGWAFITFAISAVAQLYLLDKEYMAIVIRNNQNILALRERLTWFSDYEFVLENMAAEQTWRGEPVAKEITDKLESYRKVREDLTNRLMKIAEEYTSKESN